MDEGYMIHTLDGTDYLDTVDAAAFLGMTRQYLGTLLKKGIPYMKRRVTHYIPLEELMRLREDRDASK